MFWTEYNDTLNFFFFSVSYSVQNIYSDASL